MLSPIDAYDTLWMYLAERGLLGMSLRDKVGAQVGEVRSYYLSLAEIFTNAAKGWVARENRRGAKEVSR